MMPTAGGAVGNEALYVQHRLTRLVVWLELTPRRTWVSVRGTEKTLRAPDYDLHVAWLRVRL